MSESRFTVDDPRHASPASPQRPDVADDLLPPVEPPSAGFILQLFVVPALIVLLIVMVWLTFTWLVRRTASRPEDLIQGLDSGPAVARWQRASELANALRDERFADFKRNSEAAKNLAGVLQHEIDGANATNGMQEGDVTLRFFLARALGEFEVPDGVDVLVTAAETNRDPAERLVRYGAIEAIAMRAYKLHQLKPPQELDDPKVVAALAKLAADEDPLIRSKTAYALGQIGTTESLQRLAAMVNDSHPDTRYNAAVALAHHGDDKGVETLAEMLDPEQLASVVEETDASDQAFKRAVIVSNAMQAVEKLARQNPSANLAPVLAALARLSNADASTLNKALIPSRAAADAKRLRTQLQPPK